MYPMLSLKNNLTENPVENYMIKNNSITSEKLSQYKEHTWSWDFRASYGEHMADNVHISATKSSSALNDVTMSFTDNVQPNDTKGATEYYTTDSNTNSSTDGFIKIKKLGTSYINISGLPDPNDYLTGPNSYFEIQLTFKVSQSHDSTFSGYYLRNLINSAINLSYEKVDGVIIKSIHIDNDTGEKIVMSNSNYPTSINLREGGNKADWDDVIANAFNDTQATFTVNGQDVTYNEHLLPLVLRMRIERHENNKYSLTNEITRYTEDNLSNPDYPTGTFTLEYTNPNNNSLFHESVMKLFTFDPNFGGDPATTTETYLGGLSFRYYTPPLDLDLTSLTLNPAIGYAYIFSNNGIHFRPGGTSSNTFLIRETQLDVYTDLVLHYELKFLDDFSISNTSSGSTHFLNLKLDGVGGTFNDSQITWFHRGSGIGSQYMENGGTTSESTKYCGFYPHDMRNTNIFRTTSNTYLPYFQKGTYAIDENNNYPTTSYGLNQIFVPWDHNSGGYPVREFRVGTTLYVARGNNDRNAWTTWRYYDTTSTFTASHSCSSRTIDFKSNQTPFLNGRLVEIDPDADYNDGDGWTATIDEALPQVKFTETRASKKVLGVISYKLRGTHNPIQSLGEGCMWVCNEDGNIEVGDLLTSSSHEGYATKQSDDLIRNYTVGKSTCNCNFIIGEGNCSISGNIEINTEQGFSIIVNSNNTITIGEVTLNYTGTIKRLDEDSDIVLIENGTIHATGNYPFHHNIGKGVQINSYIKITGTVDSCNTTMKLPCFEKDGIRYSFIGCIYTAG
jgi:hypothetical protein